MPPRSVIGAEPSRDVFAERPVSSSVSVAWLTVTDEVAENEPESRSVRPPPRTITAPVVSWPFVSVSTPEPAFWNSTAPVIVPANVELTVAKLLTSRLPAAPAITPPVPGSVPTLCTRSTNCVEPFRSSRPPLAKRPISVGVAAAKVVRTRIVLSPAASRSVPPLIVVPLVPAVSV